MAVAARDTTNDTFLNRLDITFFFTKKCTHMTEETRKHQKLEKNKQTKNTGKRINKNENKNIQKTNNQETKQMIVKNKYIKRKPNKQRNLQTNILTKIKQIRKPRERDTPFTMWKVPFVVVHWYKNNCHRFWVNGKIIITEDSPALDVKEYTRWNAILVSSPVSCIGNLTCWNIPLFFGAKHISSKDWIGWLDS